MLISRLPAAAHLVISTRSDPPLPLSRLRVRGQLTEYLAGSLDAAQAARVTTHLRQCASCTAYLATLRKTIDLLGALPTQPARTR